MKRGGLGILVVLAAALATAAAASTSVKLSPPGGRNALPRIGAPTTRATARINAALEALDRRWAAFARDCRAGGAGQEAARTVEVTMAGPRFLSVVARDEESCGGAHPDASTAALVYDLDTGRPVDWRRLLGPRLVTATRTDSVIDGTTIGMVSSRRLHALYLKTVRPSRDCARVLADPGLDFLLWPNARRGGLVIEPNLPHVVAACAQDGVIPRAALRREGAAQVLLAALGG